MTPTRFRTEAACRAKGMKVAHLAEPLDRSRQQVYVVVDGKIPGTDLWPKIAEILGVSATWLLTGDPQQAPTWWRTLAPQLARELDEPVPLQPEEEPFAFTAANPGVAVTVGEPAAEEGPEIAVLGTVSAGDGNLSGAPGEWRAATGAVIHFPKRWVAVEIQGNSAYPVAYPGQLAIVDLDRATAPKVIDEETLVDLDDNLCLIRTTEDGVQKGYLKRLCRAPKSPEGFVLASVDSGRKSPYVPLEVIDLIAPVVGIIFEDPSKPRLKGRNRADVSVPPLEG